MNTERPWGEIKAEHDARREAIVNAAIALLGTLAALGETPDEWRTALLSERAQAIVHDNVYQLRRAIRGD